MEENHGQKISSRSCRVMNANIRGLHKNFSELSLTARGRFAVCAFFLLRLLSVPGATFLSSSFQVSVDRCSCPEMKLISVEGCCIRA